MTTARQLAIQNENRQIDESAGRAAAAAKPRTALEILAARLDVTPSSLQETLVNTVFKGCSKAEFVALVVVSNTYELNPLLREIYAFPKKGGGIQAIVGYDGWIKIANRHEQFDGFESLHTEDENGNLKAIEGVLYRKDRAHPTKKLVYLKEFKRNTDPWNNSPRHMLDVRCFCQTVRLGFGVSLGVEGVDDIDGGDIVSTPTPTLPTQQTLAEELDDEIPALRQEEVVDEGTGEVIETDDSGMSQVDEETARALDAAQTAQGIDGPLDEDAAFEEVDEDPLPYPEADFRGDNPPEGAVRNQTWFRPVDGKLRHAHDTQNGIKWYLKPQADPVEEAQPEVAQQTDSAAEEEKPGWFDWGERHQGRHRKRSEQDISRQG